MRYHKGYLATMEVAITIGSVEKAINTNLLSAIERYQSNRISTCYEASKRRGHDFLILSAKYGLLTPTKPIPNYEKVLEPEQWVLLLPTVVGQLRNTMYLRVHFWHQDLHTYPAWKPYYDLLETACDAAGMDFIAHQL